MLYIHKKSTQMFFFSFQVKIRSTMQAATESLYPSNFTIISVLQCENFTHVSHLSNTTNRDTNALEEINVTTTKWPVTGFVIADTALRRASRYMDFYLVPCVIAVGLIGNTLSF